MEFVIEDDYQYATLRNQAAKFSESAQELRQEFEEGKTDLHPILVKAQIESLEGVYSQMATVLAAYESDLKINQSFWIRIRQPLVANVDEFRNVELVIQAFDSITQTILVRFNDPIVISASVVWFSEMIVRQGRHQYLQELQPPKEKIS